MKYDFLRGVGPGGLAGLAVGFACLGSLGTLLLLAAVRRVRERRAGIGGPGDDKAWLHTNPAHSQLEKS